MFVERLKWRVDYLYSLLIHRKKANNLANKEITLQL